MSQLGTILRSRREELNLTLAEVSRATSIRLNILEALERGKFSILPPTYIRSFCKTYWAYLRLPQENFERMYAEANISSQQDEGSFFSNLIPQNPEKEKKEIPSIQNPFALLKLPHISPRLLSSGLTIAFIFFVLLTIYFVFVKDFFSDTPIEPNSSSSQNPTESSQVSDNSSNEEGGLISYLNSDKAPDSIVLEATCIEKSYIQVTADGQKSEQVTCEPGDVKRWTALKDFVISGNIGGFILKRNNVTLPSLAKKGNLLVQAKITLNDITSSSNPYETSDSYTKPSNNISATKTSNTKSSAGSSSTKSNVKSSNSKSNTASKSTTSKPKTSVSKSANSSISTKKTTNNKSVGTTKSKTAGSSASKKSSNSSSGKSSNTKASSSSKSSTNKNKNTKPTTKTDKSAGTKTKQENKKLPSISPIQINHTKR
jgi:cytoskeletal protein RodZ